MQRETLFKSVGNRKSELVSFSNYGELEIEISTEGVLWNRDVSGLLQIQINLSLSVSCKMRKLAVG